MDDLHTVLAQTLALVRESHHDGWASRRSIGQIAQWLEQMIDGSQIDPSAIRLAFAPTGELQELAGANGWTDEYMALSRRADALLETP